MGSFVLLAALAWTHSGMAAGSAPGNEVTLQIDAGQSRIHWTLGSTLHTVHGTFALKKGMVQFNPDTGDANGEIVADATSGDSGNGSRDKKMHREILESARYPEVIFRPRRIQGRVPAEGPCQVEIQGTFLLHGAEHELSVPVNATMNGKQFQGSAKFTVPYIQWGLKSPNTFLLKADPTVEIELEMKGTIERGPLS
ncbi:MAG TPA: YceI family protein [Candidatus Acidoferrum sp.]|nr:YceI family protein [Candidatus Acidoferrum sp.]